MKQFPNNFTWGAATSSHQVEGNQHNDWSEWEPKNAQRLAREAPERFAKIAPRWEEIKPEATSPDSYISGQATDHYNRYKEDVQILKSLNLNAYRFSLEWSRFEPTKGAWEQSAVDHYRDVIDELRANNIEPWITIWHRSLPVWIDKQGGWENKKTIDNFAIFVEKVVGEYKDSVRFWMPLNEPEFEIIGGYLGGKYPPEKKNLFAAAKAFTNLAEAHRKAYVIIHRIRPDAMVGIPHAALAVDGYKNKFLNRKLAQIISYFTNWRYLNAIQHHMDFVGVQYYTRGTIKLTAKFKTQNSAGFPFVEQVEKGLPKSDMGWEIDPSGLTLYLEECWKRYRKPIVITENGIPDRNDTFRAKFITHILTETHKAIQNGIDIRGYFHWSLLDNMEWDKGFWPKFGLVSVDRTTQQRTVRESAKVYGEIARQNRLP
jgi:beta-glucosidase